MQLVPRAGDQTGFVVKLPGAQPRRFNNSAREENVHVQVLAIAAAGLAVGATGRAGAVEPKDLFALQTTVHEMCVQPDRKGDYLKVDGDLSAGATLRVVGVQATGRITKETWEGISQRLDQYKTDPRECAVSIVGLLAPLLKGP
jgi:hypothetical protein